MSRLEMSKLCVCFESIYISEVHVQDTDQSLQDPLHLRNPLDPKGSPQTVMLNVLKNACMSKRVAEGRQGR